MEQLINKFFTITESNYKKQIIFAVLFVTFLNFAQLRFIKELDSSYVWGLSMKISVFTFLIFFWASLFAGGYSFRKKQFQSIAIFKWTLIGSFSYVALRFTNDFSEELALNNTLTASRMWINALFRQAALGVIMLFVFILINYCMELLVEYLQRKKEK